MRPSHRHSKFSARRSLFEVSCPLPSGAILDPSDPERTLRGVISVPWLQRRRTALTAALLAALSGLSTAVLAEDSAGLSRIIRSGEASDPVTTDSIGLFVPAGQPASPFVPAGKFTATWSGSVAIDLRADYTFHGVFSGHLKVTVNDAVALDADGKGESVVDGQKQRLNKGPNKILVEYTAPDSGDSFVRLYWSSKETPFNPIPVTALAHAVSPEILAAEEVRRGRELFTEHRCFSCHATPGRMPELKADAPAFAGIGSRRKYDWLARWVENPSAVRPGTPMPAVLHGAESKADAEAVAAFLSSLQATDAPAVAVAAADAVEAGKGLYEKLHCVACHNAPDSAEVDPKKISQKQVLAKFTPGSLVAFLKKPSAHYAWIRMPDFKLSDTEATQLAAFLESVADKPSDRSAPTDEAMIRKGRTRVQDSGCLNCHSLSGVQNQFAAKPLSALPASSWTSGCVAEAPAADSKAPRYAFTEADRKALRAFAATDRLSITRHTAADFLERQSRALNCRECHGKFDGFPAWELLGGKLKPEWAAKFIGGTEPWKPRPWLESRMPAFPAFAADLGAGLSTLHGFGPRTATDVEPDPEMAKIGTKLVSANGGFACVSCHSVGEVGATQVFEAPGVNLSHSFERLQPDFFRRWLRSPPSLDPNSKMPAYFDEEGKSALADVLEGDGPKTIRAVWEYLRLGDKMPKPE
jgi:mono/diheme cytochrome c family protein